MNLATTDGGTRRGGAASPVLGAIERKARMLATSATEYMAGILEGRYPPVTADDLGGATAALDARPDDSERTVTFVLPHDLGTLSTAQIRPLVEALVAGRRAWEAKGYGVLYRTCGATPGLSR
jgi:hypothetical protein